MARHIQIYTEEQSAAAANDIIKLHQNKKLGWVKENVLSAGKYPLCSFCTLDLGKPGILKRKCKLIESS